MQVCAFPGCWEPHVHDYQSVAYCLEHIKGRKHMHWLTCKQCRCSQPFAFVLQPEDWLCRACIKAIKWHELRAVLEKAKFLDELDCPREVLIDAACRWAIAQDCDALNLPD